MSKFSVVIITFNEEKIIEKCVQAAKQVTDDIVIIDSFSKDRTKEICSKLDVNFIQNKWLGYSKQKNLANSNAKYDWVLSLDADEILSDNLIGELQNIHLENPKIIYKFSYLSNYCGQWIKHGRWYPQWRNRLFNKKLVHWNTALVHEGLTFDKSFKFKKLKSDVHHYSMQSKEEHLQKIIYYSNLSAKKLYDNNKKATFIKRFLNPPYRLLMDYFIKLGFLDGILGIRIAWYGAYETYLKYKKLNALYKQKSS